MAQSIEVDENTVIEGVFNITMDNARTAERFPDLPLQVASRGRAPNDSPPFFLLLCASSG